ncbi:MAG: type VI secretion system contractile sheath small subunit [Shimia sp.]
MSPQTGSSSRANKSAERVKVSYKPLESGAQDVSHPFKMLVMSGLSGNAPQHPDHPEPEARESHKVTAATLDALMANTIRPGLEIDVPNRLSGQGGTKIPIRFVPEGMGDFDPGRIAQQVPALRALLEARRDIADLARYARSSREAKSLLLEALRDTDRLNVLAAQARQAMAEMDAAAAPST